MLITTQKRICYGCPKISRSEPKGRAAGQVRRIAPIRA